MGEFYLSYICSIFFSQAQTPVLCFSSRATNQAVRQTEGGAANVNWLVCHTPLTRHGRAASHSGPPSSHSTQQHRSDLGFGKRSDSLASPWRLLAVVS